MSVRESSDPAYGAAEFTRWRGLLSLTLAWLLAPVVALVNQQTIYSVELWACGHNEAALTHIVPALCLVVAAGCGITAYRDWKHVGGGVDVELGGAATRTRFVALGGIFVSAMAALVILCQWLAVFYFDPCVRA
jgi:hypothetical protein